MRRRGTRASLERRMRELTEAGVESARLKLGAPAPEALRHYGHGNLRENLVECVAARGKMPEACARMDC